MNKAEFVTQAVALMGWSPIHYKWTVSDLLRLIYPPTRLDQVVLLEENGLKGFGTFALFSDEAHQGFWNGTRPIQAKDWRSGEHAWVVDVVAPFGGAARITSQIRARLREMGYKGRYIHFRRNYGGTLRFSRAML